MAAIRGGDDVGAMGLPAQLKQLERIAAVALR
jgi:hypothetical protein